MRTSSDRISPHTDDRPLRTLLRGICLTLLAGLVALGGVPAHAVDLTLEVTTLNPTSLDTVTYEVQGVRASTPGASATAPVSLELIGLSEGTHSLVSSFGTLRFNVDSSGIVTSVDPAKMSASGSTLTIQNTIGFPSLEIVGVQPTSLDTVTFQLRDLHFLNRVGADVTRTVPGADLATLGVTFPFEGMLVDQSFQLLSSFGDIRLVLDATGDLLPQRSSDQGKFVTSVSTLTLQNTLGFPTLTVKGAHPTSLADITFRLRDLFFNNHLGADPTRTIPGTELDGPGVSFPFEGMLIDQSFQLQSGFGDVRFVLDTAGEIVPQRAADRDKLVAAGSTITLSNSLDHRLAVTADRDSPLVAITHDLVTFNFSNLLGSETVAGSALAAGVDFQMLGMLADQPLELVSDVGVVVFDLLADGTAAFRPPAVQLTATKGALAIEGGANTLFLELLPLNRPPTASIEASGNLTILTEEQSTTVLRASASDPDGDALTCRWLEGSDVVLGPVTISTTCDLDLASLAPLAVGDHTFTLEITDGTATSTDVIVVTVENSPPVSAPSGGGVFQVGPANEVTLSGEVSDFDGDPLAFEWRTGGAVLFSGSALPPFGGAPVSLSEETVGTLTLGLGSHLVELAVSDGVNSEVSEAILVEVIDTEAPTLAPVPSRTILWPPNHELVAVSIEANARDNSGGPVTLDVTVVSNEPAEYDGDGDFEPDHEVVAVDSSAGLIELELRAERSGKGDGRVYTVTVGATDASGNRSTAEILVKAPHNR